MTLSILTVCTGNICRSPFAALYLQSKLAGVTGVTVSSAGTMARDGDSMTDEMGALAERFGLKPTTHAARYLVEPYIEKADLILPLTRGHRSEVVQMVPRKLLVTFTVREFARLGSLVSDDEVTAAAAAGGTDAEKVKAVCRLLASRRSQGDPAADPTLDDVVDPYRREDEVYELSVAQMVPALDEIARVLTLTLKAA
ncbi:arsenate reductase/protein-tyrosine-phosphatase family protein [Subtercola frigoramans]|uniref:Protein-tyrosine phosphatase n=1 Tax=Subtercola frigoramans TaxID=120298 RepID=A0ABS2L8H4_9MICO|nr:low molecular weight phosphatase family protein [Subtercola frigoramans]MBM7473400.1 protein-tyrosine phosphatase [Subtercola frigoramans]